MQIQIHIPDASVESVPTEEMQKALNRFTRNCQWYTDMFTVNDNGLIIITSCSNDRMAIAIAGLFMLVAQHPNVFGFQIQDQRSSEGTISLPKVGFWIKRKYWDAAIEILTSSYIRL